MAGDHGLSDIRFVAYDNSALAAQIDGLRNGEGTESLQNAMMALVRIAMGLSVADQTLRDQLAAIGVTWQGEAADGEPFGDEDVAVLQEDGVVRADELSGRKLFARLFAA